MASKPPSDKPPRNKKPLRLHKEDSPIPAFQRPIEQEYKPQTLCAAARWNHDELIAHLRKSFENPSTVKRMRLNIQEYLTLTDEEAELYLSSSQKLARKNAQAVNSGKPLTSPEPPGNRSIRKQFIKEVSKVLQDSTLLNNLINSFLTESDPFSLVKFLYGDNRNSSLLEDIDSYYKSSDDLDYSRHIFSVLQTCFRHQADTIFTEILTPLSRTMWSPSQDTLTILGSRRSGKTEGAIRLGAIELLQRGYKNAIGEYTARSVLYIHNDRDMLERQYFSPLVKMLEDLGLKLKIDRTALTIELPNGSVFKGLVNHHTQSITHAQGYRYTLIIIDEAQDQKWLASKLPILTPMLKDSSVCGIGRLIIQGTPPRVPCYFEELLQQPNLRHKLYTMSGDNPLFKDPAAFEAEVEKDCMRYSCSRDDPRIQREDFGRIAHDVDALVFKRVFYWNPEQIVNIDWDHIFIGVDYGGGIDENAVIGLAVSKTDRKMFVFFEKHWLQGTYETRKDAIYECIELGKTISINGSNNLYVVTDTNEPTFNNSLSNDMGIPLIPTKKDKGSVNRGIERLQDYFSTGLLMIEKGGYLDMEIKQTVWVRDDNNRIIYDIDDKVYHPNGLHALRYAVYLLDRMWGHYDCQKRLITIPPEADSVSK